MNTTPAWRRYLTFWRQNIAGDVDDELRFHTEMRVAEYRARGMSEEDARRTVAARLGDVDAARAECIEQGKLRQLHARNADFLDSLRADIRYALRSLGRAPAWTAVALLTIALGVGAGTTVFSVADSLLVRTLPYPNASRVFLAQRQFTVNGETVPVSLPFGMAKIWRERATTIEDAELAGGASDIPFGSGADTVTAVAAHVEPGFIAFAGAKPVIGRVPPIAEVTPDRHFLLLTEQFWRRQYGASPDVIGRVVTFRDAAWTIVGVVPASLTVPSFRLPRADVLTLVAATEGATGAVLVRLKPGVSREAATAELDAIMKHANLPDLRPVPMPMPLRLTKPQDWLAIRRPLQMLTAAVALLLLVACTNVTHLLLARGAVRQRELAVRHVLGAGRPRLVRQLATESVVLAVFGGALAVVVGWGGLHLLMLLKPDDRNFTGLSYVSTTHGVLAIAAALAILSGLAIGIVAALRSAHGDVAVALRTGASTAHAARRLRSLLVVGEVALSTTLLVGALMLVHALFGLEHTNLGFDANGLYGVVIQFPRGMSAAGRDAFVAEARARIASLPDVSEATETDHLLGGRGWMLLAVWETTDHPRDPRDANIGTAIYSVPPRYFSVLRMPLLSGQRFDDRSHDRNEVIVSRSLARLVAPGGNALGLQIRNAVVRSRGGIWYTPGQKAAPTPDEPWQTIVGVVPDVVTSLGQPPEPALYHPLTLADTTRPLAGRPSVTFIVRTSNRAAIGPIQQTASTLQGGQSASITNVRESIDASLAEPRFTMRILTTFAALGVLLAAIGLFGVISYSVGQRTREIGVRMTLGATRASIARLVVGNGIRLALLGIGFGVAASLVATRLIQSALYGVSRYDVFSFAVGAATLLVVAVVACVVPMWRATGVDPVIAVRAE